jgi:hypothetical protein
MLYVNTQFYFATIQSDYVYDALGGHRQITDEPHQSYITLPSLIHLCVPLALKIANRPHAFNAQDSSITSTSAELSAGSLLHYSPFTPCSSAKVAFSSLNIVSPTAKHPHQTPTRHTHRPRQRQSPTRCPKHPPLAHKMQPCDPICPDR